MSGNPQFKEELGAAEVDLSGTLKVNLAVTITYTDSTKAVISTVART
jgi:hypothetical protein